MDSSLRTGTQAEGGGTKWVLCNGIGRTFQSSIQQVPLHGAHSLQTPSVVPISVIVSVSQSVSQPASQS